MDLETAKRDLSPDEFSSTLNFHTKLFHQGIEKDIPEETLRKWMASPETYREKLSQYMMYQYITNGDIYQLYELMKIMPSLNYRIKTLKTNSKNDKHTLNIRRTMKEINHKELTRDMISQAVSTGTLVGLWVGGENSKSNESPYLMIFDDLKYFFPARRVNGKWRVWCDLSYFDSITDIEDKVDVINNLYPYVTVDDYTNYKEKGATHRYIEFPVERSVCIRCNTLRRNQRFGIPFGLSAIEDIKHKQKLRNLEKVASNKVMNAVAVLTLGIKDSESSTYKKLGEKLTRSVFESVKKGLATNKEGEASVVGLPEWAKLEYPDTKTDVLNPDKMEGVNADINNSIGITRTLTNGQGGNYASAKLNLDILYNRIGEILETIESEVYNKLIKIILPSTVAKDYYIEYEKASPLTNKEKSEMLYKLSSLGYSLRPLVDLLGLDFDEYIDNSKFEIETLKLRESIYPPQSTYTMSSDSDSGRPSDDSSDNQSTVNTRENDTNNTPSANV